MKRQDESAGVAKDFEEEEEQDQRERKSTQTTSCGRAMEDVSRSTQTPRNNAVISVDVGVGVEEAMTGEGARVNPERSDSQMVDWSDKRTAIMTPPAQVMKKQKITDVSTLSTSTDVQKVSNNTHTPQLSLFVPACSIHARTNSPSLSLSLSLSLLSHRWSFCFMCACVCLVAAAVRRVGRGKGVGNLSGGGGSLSRASFSRSRPETLFPAERVSVYEPKVQVAKPGGQAGVWGIQGSQPVKTSFAYKGQKTAKNDLLLDRRQSSTNAAGAVS